MAGLLLGLTILAAYGLPSQAAGKSPVLVVTAFRALGPNDMELAMNNQRAGYFIFDSFYGWLITSSITAALYAGILFVFGFFLKERRIRPNLGVIIMGLLGGVVSLPALWSFFVSWNWFFAYTVLTMIVGFGSSVTVFRKYADPATPDPYENTPTHKKLDKMPPPDWAIENARRISQKD